MWGKHGVQYLITVLLSRIVASDVLRPSLRALLGSDALVDAFQELSVFFLGAI